MLSLTKIITALAPIDLICRKNVEEIECAPLVRPLDSQDQDLCLVSSKRSFLPSCLHESSDWQWNHQCYLFRKPSSVTMIASATAAFVEKAQTMIPHPKPYMNSTTSQTGFSYDASSCNGKFNRD